MIVSGDEKQMPPTSFFAARPDPEEDEDLSGDERMQPTRRCRRISRKLEPARHQGLPGPPGARPQGAARHDAGDPLSLRVPRANRVLERCLLQEPAQHPARHPAETVCARSRSRWSGLMASTPPKPTGRRRRGSRAARHATGQQTGLRPSIGVVTFNRKQADLIDDGSRKGRWRTMDCG